MRTAEEIRLDSSIFRDNGISEFDIFRIEKAINEARKEAIEECAKLAPVEMGIKQSILLLINELK